MSSGACDTRGYTSRCQCLTAFTCVRVCVCICVCVCVQVTVSIVEIYCERIRCLVADSGKDNLAIKTDPLRGTFVEGTHAMPQCVRRYVCVCMYMVCACVCICVKLLCVYVCQICVCVRLCVSHPQVPPR